LEFFTQLGTYILGTEHLNQNIEFGVLVVYPQEYESQKVGQWHLTFRTFDFPESPNIDNDMRQIFINMACRLGLMPIHFLKRFEEALLSIKPICLVADTSSLFNGSLEQALHLRSGKPTHLAIPDQVYMEIQRQRESKPLSKEESNSTSDDANKEKPIILRELLRESYSHNRQISTVRALRRIEKQSGLIVHTVRPPEAMVRYFGSERGSAIDDENKSERLAWDSPNYHRDRLILEAVRNQRVLLPNIPVWLVTGDANFAIQADVEGFQVGYSWLPSVPNVRMITSPYIEPRTLTPYHLPVEAFLEEWLWYWKNITLQLSGNTKRESWTLPDKRERFRLELNDLGTECIKTEKPKSCPRRSAAQVLNSLPPSTIPLKAPLPDKLLDGLQALADKQNEQITITPDIKSYLQALGWAQNSTMSLTAKGKDLITRWNQLNREKVIEWCEWIRDAGNDFLRLEPQKQFQKALPSFGSKGKDELAKDLGISKGNVDSQSILANAFGIGVRINSKSWKTPWKTQQEAANLILNTTFQLKDTTSSGVQVGKVLATLLNSTTPLSLANFRLGLFQLVKSGKIEVNGTSPEKHIKIKVLIPNDGLQEIDLGAGDFLIPGKSCQFIIPLEKSV
jgi:hypothetical protein